MSFPTGQKRKCPQPQQAATTSDGRGIISNCFKDASVFEDKLKSMGIEPQEFIENWMKCSEKELEQAGSSDALMDDEDFMRFFVQLEEKFSQYESDDYEDPTKKSRLDQVKKSLKNVVNKSKLAASREKLRTVASQSQISDENGSKAVENLIEKLRELEVKNEVESRPSDLSEMCLASRCESSKTATVLTAFNEITSFLIEALA
jgi:hypothetical protein